ncbi:MAG: DUF2971 domain-containing protein [Treponema sp.]|nr:DUF2971 domain-containing protein [Treponema sp.]
MYLYKYTTAEAFSKIIEYGTLKVSGIEEFNDILECALPVKCDNFEKYAYLKYKELFEPSVHKNGEFDAVIEMIKRDASKDIDALAKNMASSANTIYKYIFYKLGKDWKDFKKDLRVLCLTECENSPYMWGLYAEKNKGVKLCIDTDKMMYGGKLGKVTYHDDESWFYDDFLCQTLIYKCDEQDFLKDGKLMEKMRELIAELFCMNAFRKSTEWEKEKEWRIVMYKDNKNVIHRNGADFIKLPKDALRDIVLGANCDSGYNVAIRNLAKKYPDARIFPARVVDGKLDSQMDELIGFVQP